MPSITKHRLNHTNVFITFYLIILKVYCFKNAHFALILMLRFSLLDPIASLFSSFASLFFFFIIQLLSLKTKGSFARKGLKNRLEQIQRL